MMACRVSLERSLKRAVQFGASHDHTLSLSLKCRFTCLRAASGSRASSLTHLRIGHLDPGTKSVACSSLRC